MNIEVAMLIFRYTLGVILGATNIGVNAKVSFHLVWYVEWEILKGKSEQIIDKLCKFNFGSFPAWGMPSVSFRNS